MKLFIYGAGYVGCITAACCAKIGHEVVLLDTSETKISRLQSGESPVLEPGLGELIAAAFADGKLRAEVATAEAHEGLAEADAALVCVGTPSGKDGTMDTRSLRQVLAMIARGAAIRQTPLTVMIRSTALAPRLREIMADVTLRGADRIRIVVSPEFLREGTAVSDFFNPPLVVAGGDDPEAVGLALSVFEGIDGPRFETSLETASMLKYSCNAFHALKTAFINEIDTLAAMLGADGKEVANLLVQDRVLNISPAYLRPGFAFGGSCLGKDIRALVALAQENHHLLPLLSAILPSNRERLERALTTILSAPCRRLAMIGLTFKAGSDDLRESPYVELVERLIGKGCKVKIFEPDLPPGTASAVLSAYPHLAELLVGSAEEACAGAEAAVVCKAILTPEKLLALSSEGIRVHDLNRMDYVARAEEPIATRIPFEPGSLPWTVQTAYPFARS